MKKKNIIILSVILVGAISLFCFVKEDETNLETKPVEIVATNKNTGIAFTVNGLETDIAFPKKDTGYLGEKVECTNNVEGLWNNETWKLEISNISTTTNCKINFIEYNPFLYSKILEDNPNVSERTDFSIAFTESNNGNTIYKATGEGGADTYYFAGNVINNYVKFGTDASGNELYWRIVRVNEDNSVRLIYAGTSATDTAAFISTGQKFNNTSNSSEYAGYMYTLGEQHGLGTNSDIKGVVDTWYANNLTDEDKYISKTAIYCNDRSTVTDGPWVATGTPFYYDAYYRLHSTPANYKPVFTCTNASDKFTASSTTGNGALEHAIALITADEVAFAGGLWATQNTSYYIATNASTGDDHWWTMSSYRRATSGVGMFIVSVSSPPGYLHYSNVATSLGVRPVVSLKSCVLWSGGNGTADSPYEVKLSESCESVENEVLDENVVRVSATTNDSTMATVVAPASVLKNIGDSHTFTFNVNEGYTYKNVEGCTGTYNETDNTLTINSIATSTTCKVNFEEKPQIVLYNQILTDNPNRATRSTFDAVYTTSNGGNTIHYGAGEGGATTYYFAGNVTNNYVKFGTNSSGAELWWRIVRINEDNSVRLLYAGTSATDRAGFISTSQAFNSTYNASYYVGYERSTAQHGTGTNSDIKGVVDTWYTTHLSDESSYLSQTAIYCNDRSTVTGRTWAATGSTFYYDAYYRLAQTTKAPVFTCTNANDKFTVSSTTGNGALENPIALITADEISYAGGLWGTNNTSYYIATNASSGASYWWTMSPYFWYSSGYADVFRVGGSSSTGYLSNTTAGLVETNGVRPVVSLKSCVLWSGGDGTSGNPYTVTINDACKSAIN